MNFDNLADGLYGLPPGQFVAERTAAEKQARSLGDRELAAQIHQLAKPTTVGWLANQLVRRYPEEIGPLLELGAGLREATASLSREKLQDLMRLQHQVIAGLIKQGRAIAHDAGQRLSEDATRGLEDTLRAALADESLGEQLLQGRLTGALEPVGFTASTSRQSHPQALPKNSAPDPQLAKAEREVAEAEADVEAAATAQHKAQVRLDATSEATRELSKKVQRLQADLDRASSDHSAAKHAESEARSAAERKERERVEARQRLEEAVAKRNELAS